MNYVPESIDEATMPSYRKGWEEVFNEIAASDHRFERIKDLKDKPGNVHPGVWIPQGIVLRGDHDDIICVMLPAAEIFKSRFNKFLSNKITETDRPIPVDLWLFQLSTKTANPVKKPPFVDIPLNPPAGWYSYGKYLVNEMLGILDQIPSNSSKTWWESGGKTDLIKAGARPVQVYKKESGNGKDLPKDIHPNMPDAVYYQLNSDPTLIVVITYASIGRPKQITLDLVGFNSRTGKIENTNQWISKIPVSDRVLSEFIRAIRDNGEDGDFPLIIWK